MSTENYQRLAAAILVRAVKDSIDGNGYAAGARRWLLYSPWAADLMDGLGLDPVRARRWVDSLDPVGQPELPGLWGEEVLTDLFTQTATVG